MKKVGQIFKEKREQDLLDLKEVSKQIKVPLNFLKALENEDYKQLPEGLYPGLYVRKYARFLDLDEEKILAFFRRDYVKEEEEKKLSFTSFALGKRWMRYLGVALVIFVFLGYLGYQYWTYVRPPSVKINLVKKEESFVLQGKTNSQATLKIDGEVVLLNDNGKFDYPVRKNKDEFVVEVVSPSGRTREFTKTFE